MKEGIQNLFGRGELNFVVATRIDEVTSYVKCQKRKDPSDPAMNDLCWRAKFSY